MTTIDGKAILAAFHYVRDFHRAASRMLLAADGLLAGSDWAPHGDGWKSIPASKRSLQSPERWVPHFINRQFYRDGVKVRGELLTLSVIAHDPIDDAIDQPLLIASRMRAMTNGNELYWIPTVGLRCRDGVRPLGQVRHVRKDDLKPKPARLKAFEASVGGGELLSLIVPLVSVTDDASLEEKLLKPILVAEYFSQNT